MGVLRLGICVGGVYAAFLLWAIAQERLSTRFPSTAPPPHHTPGELEGDTFPSPLFLNWAQALASCISSAIYLIFTSSKSNSTARRGVWHTLGFDRFIGASGSVVTVPPTPSASRAGRQGGSDMSREPSQTSTGTASSVSSPGADLARRPSAVVEKGRLKGRGAAGGKGEAEAEAVSEKRDVDIRFNQDSGVGQPSSTVKAPVTTSWRHSLPALLLQVSIFQTTAGPIGFMALRHISYPTMVLGKSCKLIPVMMLNVLLYRRRFSAHKYVVVALVTVGISMFMLWAPVKKSKGATEDSAWGLTLLLINLLIDGLTNSTQDQIFTLHPGYGGQEMMFHMSLLAQSLLLPSILLPLPSHPLSLAHYLPSPIINPLRPHFPLLSTPLTWSPPAAYTCVQFLLTHPTALPPLLAYALLGGVGQLFIFETIAHFGSLTLTMVTVTRKLFTMLLSVLVFDHQLTTGQWAGVGVVFAGIGVEAGVKRRDVMRKARRDG